MVTRVTEPNEGDWKKLVKMMNYLKSTKDDVPCMSADDASMIKQVACRCFLCHPQGHEKSHWSHYDSWLWYHLCSISTKQNLNTQSSTNAELVGFDDVTSKILWSKLFSEAQARL
jgi:hypothetical protein